MGECHLFQDPLLRPDWTLGWGHEQITLGDHKNPGYWGEETQACRTSGRGGAKTPPSKKTQSVRNTQ